MLAVGAEHRSLEAQSVGMAPNVPISHLGSMLGNSLQDCAPDSVFRKSSPPQWFPPKLHEEMRQNHGTVAGSAIATVHGCKACQNRGFHLLSDAHVNETVGRSSLCYEVCGTCHGTCLVPPTIHRKQLDPDAAFALQCASEGFGCMLKIRGAAVEQ